VDHLSDPGVAPEAFAEYLRPFNHEEVPDETLAALLAFFQ
jgi:hypothetical protein